MNAEVQSTENLNYKDGYVQCQCGWRKDLGDGFNGYRISSCPKCDLSVSTRSQRKVITGNPRGHGLTVELGHFTYFALSNGIHVQYSKCVSRTVTGLSESQADRL